MLTKVFREQCKSRGFTFTADKEFVPDKRANITIKELASGNKAKFSILQMFGEMDVAGWTDMTEFSPEFKKVIIETIDHIAINRGAKVVLYSIHSIFDEKEITTWKLMDGFNEYSDLYTDATLFEEAPVKVYDKRALFDRIELYRTVQAVLDSTDIFEKYIIKNHLAEFQIWWKDRDEVFKELRIRSQNGYQVKIGSNDEIFLADNLEQLQIFIKAFVQDNF